MEMREKRREWTRTIVRAKITHLKEFLDNVGSGNLWKAAMYMGPRDSFANIPSLKVGPTEFPDNGDKARILMESFFPKMADLNSETSITERGNPMGTDY
jgi:hypothetical protein